MYLQSNQKEILINFSNIDELYKNKLKFRTIIDQISNTSRFKILYQSNFLRQITASLGKQRNVIKEDPF